MRISVPGLVLAAALLGGCCTSPPPEIIGPAWDSPEKAYATFRAAILAERPDLIYASLSPGFKAEYEVPDERQFTAGYEAAKDGELRYIGRVFEEAGIDRVEYRVHGPTGLNLARVVVSAGDMRASFVLVEIPTARLVVAFEGYDPEPVDFFVPGDAFGGHLRVGDDGVVRIAFDGSGAGITSASELREFRLHRQWLLLDVEDLPVDLRRIMESVRASAGDAP